MTIKLTIREINEKNLWNEFGLDPYCMNDGRATGDETYEMEEERAKELGII